MARPVARSSPAAALPAWIPPQLTQLVDAAPEGDQWLHEIKFDGYRMHARLDRGTVKLLTRTGLDWTHKYPPIAAAVASLGARQAYLDGELCGVFPDGITSFGMIQAASDAGDAAGLVFFIFDLLHLDGDDVGARPLIERKALLATLLAGVAPPPALQRLPARPGSDVPRAGLQTGARGHRLETRRCRLRSRQSRIVAQGQMPAPRGICRGGLDRSRGKAAVARRVACSPTTIRKGGWSMPAAPALASGRRSSNGCGDAPSDAVPGRLLRTFGFTSQ
jgi:ATP dependent DNA ligase domain